MQAFLVYNPNSGNASGIELEDILGWMRNAGFDPVYRETREESNLDYLHEVSDGSIMAVGGDGTVRAIATRVIGRNLPIAILPAGTANNIAMSLGIDGAPQDVIAGLKDPIRRPFDMGCIRTPNSSTYFLEACGYGYFASVLEAYRPEEGKSILRSLVAFAQTVPGFSAEECKLALDGMDISGSYLMLEVMNTQSLGMRFKLASGANPGDGLLDVVRIREDGRENLFRYISELLNGGLDDLASVEVERGRKLEMIWPGTFPLHADAEVIPAIRDTDNPGLFPVTVEILPSALEFWIPRSPAPGEGDMEKEGTHSDG